MLVSPSSRSIKVATPKAVGIFCCIHDCFECDTFIVAAPNIGAAESSANNGCVASEVVAFSLEANKMSYNAH